MLKVAPTHENQNPARLVVEANHCALQIFRWRLVRNRAGGFGFAEIRRVFGVRLVIVIGLLLGPLEILTQRFLGDFLQIGIDGGADAEAFIHRAVPADGIDHLLADVIDGVILPLRVLAIADDQLFALRAKPGLIVDQTEVAHPAESIVARVARGGAVRPRREAIRALDQPSEGGAFG